MTPTRTVPGGVFLTPVSLLNANQQRRLGTHLRLLADDLDAVAALPDLATSEPRHARVRELVAEARALVDETRGALELPAEQGPALGRRIAAVAGVWAARVEDLRARRLKGYGAVHEELAGILDPRIERLRRVLEALADAGAAC
jgi:hypothetical protein